MTTPTTEFADLNELTERFVGLRVSDVDPHTGRPVFDPSDTLPCDRCAQVRATITLGVEWNTATERLCASCAWHALSGCGESERTCRVCACTESRACDTLTGPCAWATLYDDDTGICTACYRAAADDTEGRVHGEG